MADNQSELDSSIQDSDTPGDTQEDDARDETPSKPWYHAPKFAAYWRHYHRTWEWFRQHENFMESMRAQRSQQSSLMTSLEQQRLYHQQCAQWYSMWQHYFVQSQSTPPRAPHGNRKSPHQLFTSREKRPRHKSKKSKRKKKKTNAPRKKICIDIKTTRSNTHPDEGSESEGSEVHMEFTAEMLDFFSQSAKHRQEREAKKEAKKEDGTTENQDYVQLGEEQASQNATVLPPTERPGVKLTSEMKYLYGKGAAMIHGMETAMQLNYDRNCDRKAPRLWPNLPLNITFK